MFCLLVTLDTLFDRNGPEATFQSPLKRWRAKYKKNEAFAAARQMLGRVSFIYFLFSGYFVKMRHCTDTSC